LAAQTRIAPTACPIGTLPEAPKGWRSLWTAYRLRLRRRSFLARAFRRRTDLTCRVNRTSVINPPDVLGFLCVRNESTRLPFLLDHYRRLGVRHFLAVDNGSGDGTDGWLADQPDVSLWQTTASYKASRFGLDWVTWLLIRYGHGHWCLTVDADEILIYPHWQTRPLPALTDWLDRQGRRSFGALMVDMYPEGPVSQPGPAPGEDPLQHLQYFDAGNYQVQVQPRMGNLWIQGGARARAFFGLEPRRAPTLNKIPLVKWHWRFAYVNSTHALLPPHLNKIYETDGGELTSGVLLHTKFLPEIVVRAAEEKARGEHFAEAAHYGAYYDRLVDDPCLHTSGSSRYTGWRQMEALGLMSRGGWI
jgi:hypothetical protein